MEEIVELQLSLYPSVKMGSTRESRFRLQSQAIWAIE